MNAVSGKTSGNTHSDKVKKCFGCGLEGHFKGDYKCPARGKACRECGDYDHFRNQCCWVRLHGGGRGAAGGGRGAVGGGRGAAGGGRGATGGGRFQRRPGRAREANHVAGVDDSDQPSEQVQRSPEYAFTVGSPEKQYSGLVTLVVGGVELPDVLIDSGATCNLIGQQTWNMLKKKGSNVSLARQPESSTRMVAPNRCRLLERSLQMLFWLTTTTLVARLTSL